MDRLEQYILQALAPLAAGAREAVRVAGMLVPLLLFADDLVLISRQHDVLQRLLQILCQFCEVNGLTVNLGKSAWVAGGMVPRAADWGHLYYEGAVLPRAPKYKYLGLEWDGSPSMGAMISARLTAAQATWAKLIGLISGLGWRDRATRLLLFDTYVRSSLLYGCPVWGMEFLRRDGGLAVDTTGPFGVFYRRCLRSLMGLPHTLRNEILYVLSGRPPLQLPLGRMVWRFVQSMGGQPSPRLVTRLYGWVTGLDLTSYHHRLSICAAGDFAGCFPSLQAMGAAVLAGVRAGLAQSDRLVGRPLLAVWLELAGLAFAATRRQLVLPAAWTGLHPLRSHCPSFRFAWSRARVPQPVICPRASWLQLPAPALHRLVDRLYEHTRSIPVAVE